MKDLAASSSQTTENQNINPKDFNINLDKVELIEGDILDYNKLYTALLVSDDFELDSKRSELDLGTIMAS